MQFFIVQYLMGVFCWKKCIESNTNNYVEKWGNLDSNFNSLEFNFKYYNSLKWMIFYSIASVASQKFWDFFSNPFIVEKCIFSSVGDPKIAAIATFALGLVHHCCIVIKLIIFNRYLSAISSHFFLTIL